MENEINRALDNRALDMFPRGIRVRLNDEYVRITGCKKNAGCQKKGTVIGWSRNGICARVHWDGNKKSSLSTYHWSFLEKAEND